MVKIISKARDFTDMGRKKTICLDSTKLFEQSF